MKKEKAIITGGTGVIGIALIQCLLANHVEVTVLMNPNSNRKAVLEQFKDIQIVLADMSQLKQVETILPKDYTYFFHLAWMGTFGDSRNDMYLQTKNIEYTLDAVKLAKALGCEVFLGTGSQAEYGPVKEKMSAETPTNPVTGYGIAKLCANRMSRIYAQSLGLRHVWVRVLSVFGPYDGQGTMVMSGLKNMLAGHEGKYTKGEQMWDYLYCDDAAQALYQAAKNGKDGKIYPLGSGEVKPLKEYIEIMRDNVDPNLSLDFGAVPYYPNQVMYMCADIEDLKKDTGFEPKHTFDEGIKKTIQWIKEGD